MLKKFIYLFIIINIITVINVWITTCVLTTVRMLSVISFSCCTMFNLNEGGREGPIGRQVRSDTFQNKSTRSGNREEKKHLHVHLVGSRFGLFLWEAAQHDCSDGPSKGKTYMRQHPSISTVCVRYHKQEETLIIYFTSLLLSSFQGPSECGRTHQRL